MPVESWCPFVGRGGRPGSPPGCAEDTGVAYPRSSGRREMMPTGRRGGQAPHDRQGPMKLITRSQAILARRSVLWTLVIRDLRVRYSRSVLGYLWTILDPLLMSS